MLNQIPRGNSKRWLNIWLGIALSCFSVSSLAQEFEPLFNGKDLTGWVLVNTPPDTWKVDDGMLICSGRPIGEMRTEKMYQNFELEVEWRHLVPKGNAGIFVWADDITARGVPFHRGIEVQVLENAYGNTRSYSTHGDIFPIHGAKMTPINGRGGDRAFPTEERSKPSPEWNHYRIVCQDGNIALSVNGKEVTRGTRASPSKGYLCIESEGGVVHYRNMKIKVLPDTPIDESQIAVADRGYRSIYSGLDLRDWKSSDVTSWKVNDWILDHSPSTAGSQSSLTYNKQKPLNGFVMDFRLPDANSTVSLQVPGVGKPVIISKDTPEIGESLVQRGGWNRIEGTITQQSGQATLVLNINGKNSTLQSESTAQALMIECSGKVSLANLYVR
jgi:hypothetical protein